MYQNEDYLAKKIAEEMVKAEKIERKKEKIKNIRTILSLVYICYIFVESGAFYELREDLDFIIMLITAFYWGYSVMWMKAHDTK